MHASISSLGSTSTIVSFHRRNLSLGILLRIEESFKRVVKLWAGNFIILLAGWRIQADGYGIHGLCKKRNDIFAIV